MKKNNSLKEVSKMLASVDSALIFPHIFMDGDTLGSAVALCLGLRAMGKNAHILIEDDIPGNLKFLDCGLCTYDMDIIMAPDICIGVDCADVERFIKRREKFISGKTTLNIDHHKTAKLFADINYIDNESAATGEIIFALLKEMGVKMDKVIGEAIYAAILTDTGNFQYSNTNTNSHSITIELFNSGIDHSYVNMMLYQNTRIEKLHTSGKILNTIKMMANNEAVMAYVTFGMLAEAGALMEDTEGASEMLRNISGVELSIFAKEAGRNETKFSMRSKKWVDVTELTVKHGGGGHARAAGCTIKLPLQEAMKLIEVEVEEYFAGARCQK